MNTSRLKKTNSLILLVMLVLLVGIAGTSPGRTVMQTVLQPIRRFLVAPVTYEEPAETEALRAENQRLRRQITALNEEQRAVENRFDTVTAGVVSYSPRPQRNAIIIDVGTSDGVEVGATTISKGFFIGEVISVEENTSTVALINDASFRAVGETEQQTHGILSGEYNSIILNRIPQGAQLEEGDIVFTSKLDTQLVGDLPIGRVQAIFSEGELLKYAQVRSPIDFTKLTTVSVIR